ncbi:MAG: CHAT domain-containing protein [Rhizonema sp. PD37]|nr:CHAT domain-containing protein [Rhizonema sp. PD37]
MSNTVVINPGSGDSHNGFPKLTVQLWAADRPQRQQFIGSLPPAPELIELYRNWQSIYQALCDRKHLRHSSMVDDDELEIDDGYVTNVSQISFDEVCQKLQEGMNHWLNSEGFLNVSRQMRSQLDPGAEIRIVMETDDDLMRRLPWHRCDFYRDYPLAEAALSLSEYKPLNQLKVSRNKVRILAILGNSQGINLEAEIKFLQSIEDAEVVFLVKPSRQEFNTQLWDTDGWDILFFAGHSQTLGETGKIYINENKTNNSLTIEQLEEALKAAIDKGLRLAIFNSCDGLGLAIALEKLNIPAVIVMREPVPNIVAEEFFKHFMEAFALSRLPLYLAVQQARRKLQGLEDDFPGASWLPTICINPATEPPSWLKLGATPPCPYRGLFAFREEDSHLFFGREQFTRDLAKAVKRKPLVAVVGASGSGKSSVVFAGLIPLLRQDNFARWQIVSFRPGNNPIKALAAALAPLVSREEMELAFVLREYQTLSKVIEKLVQQNPGTRLVLIADQFEELYTQTPESEHQPFLDALLTACRYTPAFTLVITLRADFYGYALSYRPFSDALQGAVLNLAPMSREELHSVIEKPAAQMQVSLENELTNKLIHDLEGESGSLPLLEFALTQLWSKQQSGRLTHQAYEEIGGVEEALANHAEYVYANLHEADRFRAQRVFMQLVRLGDGVEATRRLATRNEVKEENWDLVTHLASTRLVVTNLDESTSCETVEIVHEALIRSWGRLEYWMQIDGEFRRAQDQLRAAIRQWENSDHDEGALLRGKPLADAEYWQMNRLEELSSLERSFIQTSLELRDREIEKHKKRQQLTIFGLISGLVLALSLAGIAWWQSQKAQLSEIQAITTSSEALFTSNNRLDALVEALRGKQKLQMLGSVDADTHNQVESVLKRAIFGANEYNRLSGHSDKVYTVAFSPDGQEIATASADKTAKLWKRDGTLLTTLKGHSDQVYTVAFSPRGDTIATGSGDETVKLWKRDGTLLTTFHGHNAQVYTVAFSPDGQKIATGSGDKTVKLWKRDGTLLCTMKGHSAQVSAVAFSPQGNTIASASWDKTARLWNTDGSLLKTLNHSAPVSAIAFSPQGNTIASASWDKKVTLWKLDGTRQNTLNGHNTEVYAVAFSPQGNTIASAGWDRTIKVWQLDGTEITTLNGHSGTIWGVAFSPQGDTIASASDDKTVKLWHWNHTLLTTLNGHKSRVNAVAISPDSQTIASASEEGIVKLWKRDGTLKTTINAHNAAIWGVAFSPDCKTVASASYDNTVKLWKLDGESALQEGIQRQSPRSGNPPAVLAPPQATDVSVSGSDGGASPRRGTLQTTLIGHTDYVNAVAFSPDNQMIATASDDTTVKLWRRDGTYITTLPGHTNEVWGVTFSPDSQMIVSTSRDKTVKLWRRNGTLLTTLHGHTGFVTAVAFSPQGNIFATASVDKTVKLWRSDGTLLTTFHGHNAPVWGVAFSPQGNMIASTGDDKTVKIWQPDGKLLTTLDDHNAKIWGVVFSPDGKTIASASEDRTVILWDLDRVLNSHKLLTYGCHLVSDYLHTNIDLRNGILRQDVSRLLRLCTPR